MSQTVNSMIDERIVEMKFDNKQFESGVKQTMSTLDRLKEKLSFHNDVKGIDNIQNSINRMDFSIAMRGIDAFSQRLTALQIFGKRIVENLADDFYGAIKKVEQGIKGVFNQISTGGANRALNIEQAKFQLEGLHIAWEDIKGDIDYAVSGTAYGLDAAARVAAQLSASQVQVGDDMKAALRGISGVAAMTNSSYEEIGRIFSQVAGAGRLYTQDMLQMSSRGLNIAAALGQQLGHTEAEIREMVTKGQIDFKTFATAMNDAFGEQATKANNTYTGSLSNVKAALSRIGADIKAGHFETFRQVFVDLIPKLNEFKKAFKPVENVIIEVEAAVGKLIQKIIQMIDVSKIVQKIAKPVEKFGRKILDVVDVIRLALEETDKVVEDSPFAKLVGDIKKGYTTFEEYNKKFKYVSREMAMRMGGFGDAVKASGKEIQKTNEETVKMSEDMEKALQAAKDIWNKGTYGNGQARIDALTAAGIDPEKTQAIIEEFIKNGYDWDAAVKKVSEDTANGVEENSERAEKLKKRVQTLATIFSNIKRTFKAVATSVVNVVSALFKSVTGTMEKFGVGDIIIKITGFIADMAEKFMITEEKAEKLTKPIALIQSIFKGIIGIGKKVVKFIFGLVVGIGELAYSIGETIAGSETIQSFIKSFSKGIKTIRDGIKSFIDTSKQSSGLKKFVDVLKSIGSTLLGVLGSAILKIVDILGWAINHLDSFFSTIADIFGMIFGGIFTAGTKIGDFLGSLIDSIGEGTFIEDFKAKFDFLFSDNNEAEAGQTIFQKAIGYVKGVFDWVVKLFDQHTLDEYLVVIKELLSITLILESMMLIGKIEKLFKNGISLIGTVDKVLKSTVKVNKSIANLNNAKALAQIAKVILAFAASVSLIMFTVVKVTDYLSENVERVAIFETVIKRVKEVMTKVFLSILGLIAALKLMDLAITVFTSKTKLHVPLLLQFGAFMFAIGYAIKQVLQAMIELADMDGDKLKTGGERLAKIGVAIGGFFIVVSAIMGVINKFIGGGAEQATKGLYAMSLVLIAMALSVDILMAAVSWMSMMIIGYGTETVDKAVGYIEDIIGTIMLTLSVLLWAAGFFNGHTADQDIAKMFAAIAVLFLSIGVSLIGICLAINDLTLSLKLMPTETILAFTMVWIAITTILAVIAMIVSQSKNMNENGRKSMNSLLLLVFLLDIMIAEIGHFANKIDNEIELGAVGAVMLGLIGILASMAALMKAIGDAKPDPKAIAFLAIAFAGLGALIVPLIFFNKQSGWDALSIAIAMAGLSAVIAVMVPLMKTIGEAKPDPKAIAFLAIAFAGVASLLVPLIFLKGEDWPAYIAAMLGLSAVVGMMAVVFKVLEATTTPAQIVAIGGAMAILAASLALLGGVLAAVSGMVDIEKLLSLTFSIILLTAAITAVIAVATKLAGPTFIAAVGMFAGAFIGVAASIALVLYMFAKLIQEIPHLSDTLATAGYQIGNGVVRFVKEMINGVRDALDSHSPSGVFIQIGNDCIEGFIIGIKEKLASAPKILSEGFRKYIIEPVCDFFDINSPSKVFEEIGGFLGDGLQLGLSDKLENFDFSSVKDFGTNLKESLFTNTSGISDFVGNGLFSNLGDSLKLDDIGDFDSFLSKEVDSKDFSSFTDSLGVAIGDATSDGVNKGMRGVQYTDLYSLDDLLADESLYHRLKDEGETQLTAAYEDWQRHAEFMSKYPTYQAWLDDIENNYPALMVEAYRNGDEKVRSEFEAGAFANYIDQSQLDKNTLTYTKKYKESLDKAIDETFNKDNVGAGMATAGTALINMKLQDSDGNMIKLGDVESFFGSKSDLNMHLDDTQLSTNLNAVSGDISSVINAQGDKIAQKLEYITDRVNTFDTNQMNRTQNLINRINQMESAINNIKVQLDTGALVGQLVVPFDEALGERSKRKARG